MAKLNMAKFGGVRGTKLEPENLEEEAAIFTVKEYHEQPNKGQGRGLTPVFRYAECPEFLHYLNREQLERIVPHYGDDPDLWIGKKIPVHIEDVDGPSQSNPKDIVSYRKVYVMKPEDWAEAFKAAGLTATGGDAPKTAKAAKSVKKVKSAKKDA